MVLALIPAEHRLFFRVLAATGLRISEAVALQWKHLQLDGERPHIKVRRGVVRNRFEPPKSKHGRREVPITPALVDALRAHQAATCGNDDALAFAASNGSLLNQSNLRRRVLQPAAEEACLWSG
jgi:integrase